MAKFYGTVDGNLTKTNGTNRGSQYIKSSVQSYDGSVITELTYKGEKLYVSVSVDDDSATRGTELFYGTFEEFKECLKAWKGDKEEEPIRLTPYERTRNAVYSTGNKWAIENFNATHN